MVDRIENEEVIDMTREKRTLWKNLGKRKAQMTGLIEIQRRAERYPGK